MKKTRFLRNLVILLCFFLFWALSALGISALAKRQTRDRLLVTRSRVAATIEQQMLDRAENFKNHYSIARASSGTVLPLDKDLLQQYADMYQSEFVAIDRFGDIIVGDGGSVTSFGSKFANTIQNQGYSFIYLSEWNGHKNYYALGYKLDAPNKTMLVMLIPAELFVRLIEQEFPSDISAAAIFNEWGSPVSGTGSADGGPADAKLHERAKQYVSDRIPTVPSNIFLGDDSYIFLPIYLQDTLFIGFTVTESQISSAYPAVRVAFYGLFTASLAALLLDLLLFSPSRRRTGETIMKHDTLTGLMMLSEMELEIQQFFKKNTPRNYCFVQMDIISFRRFNMMFGFNSGDLLLKMVGSCIRENYLCGARLNSDIFAFIAPVHEGFIEEMEQKFLQMASRDLGDLYTQMTGFKFGLFPLLQEKFSFRDAIDGSMLALRSSKNDVKKSCTIYDSEMLKTDKINKRIAMNMLTALESEEFLMYIQPKFTADGTRCGGGEALVRWQSEQLGFLLPYQFIPLFERNGFIAELDFYMLDKVLSFLQECHESGKKLLPLSVNQSRITIMLSNYLDRIKEIVKKYQIPLHYVEIEITENVFTENYETIGMLIYEIRGMGFSIAMDDFGKGYSSLSALRELPVDILKIDKEFLNESDVSQSGRKIIHNILNLARDLGIGTVCEGVETGTQLEFLRKSGCDLLQGFYLSRPMSAQDYCEKFVPKNPS